MDSDKPGDQARNSRIDKSDAYRSEEDPRGTQGGGKLGSGNEASGHPANNVIVREQRHDANPDASSQPGTGADADADGIGADSGLEKGSKGSGMPVLSGAGRLADDRPGRNDPKSRK